MSLRYKGGIISATPPVLQPNAGASGEWTLQQQMQAIAAGNWPVNGPFWIEDVFSTYLYTGNGSTQTITNGIDLAGKGGLVWLKSRSGPLPTRDHALTDTVRGADKKLATNTTGAQAGPDSTLTAFNSNGFSLGHDADGNYDTNTYVSWTFAKQAKFFTESIKSHTNGSASTVDLSSLGTVGFVIVKRTDNTGNWYVWHRSLTSGYNLYLNTTDVEFNTNAYLSVSGTTLTIASGMPTGTYIVYAYAHDAGGFGASGSDNVISCGSFTADGSGKATISLGYEPQWVLLKNATYPEQWNILDTMRGWSMSSVDPTLEPNTSRAEQADGYGNPTATGFVAESSFSASQTYIYIAIRRGPMKTPTDATKVFAPQSPNSGSSFPYVITNFPVDMGIVVTDKTTTTGRIIASRLTGDFYMETQSAAAQQSGGGTVPFDSNVGWLALSNSTLASWNFARAPNFFDEVCFSGSDSNFTVNHNLQAIPELVIVKKRSGTGGWFVSGTVVGFNAADDNYGLFLNTTAATGSVAVFNQTWTSSAMYMTGGVNFPAGSTGVAYLFATCPGVSKVGSYTGNGSSQTINCGFTGGSRFVLIKRTDSTGDWYVFDSARGIVAGNDPYLLLNSTAAEVTTYDAVDTDSTGFIVNNDNTNYPVNVNTATYIFLAIA